MQEIVGIWKNEKGSILEVMDVEEIEGADAATGFNPTSSYRFSGLFQTAKGAVPKNIKNPVTGFILPDPNTACVSFSVSYAGIKTDSDGEQKEVQSLASFAGRFIDNEIRTIWNLVYDFDKDNDNDNEGINDWQIAISGYDVFKKVST